MSRNPNHPTLVKQYLKEYEHMTEKERMIAGYVYVPTDEQRLKERTEAH